MSNDKDSNPFDFRTMREKEESAILHRLDERTERIDSRMERMDGRVQEQNERLDEHDDRIQRNQTILNAITFGFGSFVAAVMAKLGGFIRFF
ncbi:hypothetical protein HRTV-25_gp12 [Halorubrum tailed virus 25]|uniref:Uncharacterized protein n=1 Tax=Halorubrum tailed virus 25 TaxID=2878006 RepID=A0AAE9BYU7_9CAUD|nr:hypothetical protein M1M37_gp012 [Halorubrum tailed virus 25]UBF22593.1 hypothetical protein HRTV-25_gp12 [Halorubrum tailed virus 25]